jgi:hypothetical protein
MPLPLLGAAVAGIGRIGTIAGRGAVAGDLLPGGGGGAPGRVPPVRPEIRTEGLAELRRDLKRLDPLIDRELRDAIRDAADKVAVTAGALAPRRSGELAHSIRPFVSGAKASVGSSLPQAGWLEFGGTIRPRGVPITIKGSGFVGRAVEDHADQIVEDIGDGIDRAARRAGWRH